MTVSLIIIVLCTSAALAAPLQDYVGTFINTDKNTRGITKVTITRVGSRTVYVQVWGKAHPQDNDFGRVIAYPYSNSLGQNFQQNTVALLADFSHDFGRRRLLLKRFGKFLDIQEFMRFTDRSGRNNYTNHYRLNKFEMISVKPVLTKPFKPGLIAAAMNEDKLDFNWRTTKLRRMGGHYKLVDGNHLIKDLGTNFREANQALKVVRHYRMNSIGFIGRPQPSMTYFLTDGRAPTGVLRGEDAVRFNPNRIRAKRVGGRWKIVEDNHLIMDFDQNRRECHQALQIIKKYGFTRQGFVGRPNPVLTYFVK